MDELSIVEMKEYKEAQVRYCDDNDLPCFAPPDGHCYKCGHQIYGGRFGFTKKQASAMLITYCPYCSYSFVG